MLAFDFVRVLGLSRKGITRCAMTLGRERENVDGPLDLDGWCCSKVTGHEVHNSLLQPSAVRAIANEAYPCMPHDWISDPDTGRRLVTV
jgi:hypothetical protein